MFLGTSGDAEDFPYPIQATETSGDHGGYIPVGRNRVIRREQSPDEHTIREPAMIITSSENIASTGKKIKVGSLFISNH